MDIHMYYFEYFARSPHLRHHIHTHKIKEQHNMYILYTLHIMLHIFVN